MFDQTLQIINAERVVDGQGISESSSLLKVKAKGFDIPIIEIHIAPLKMGWGKPIPPGYLQGAYAPFKAILDHKKEIEQGSLLIIAGRDFLKTEYSKEERRMLFEAYGDGRSFLTGYHELTKHYLSKSGISLKDFCEVRDALFENYWRTWQSQNTNGSRPHSKWFDTLEQAPLFRGVDCANPLVDFEGSIAVANNTISDLLEIPLGDRLSVVGIGIAQKGEDGPQWIPEITQYTHLRTAVEQAISDTHLNLKDLKGMVYCNQARLCLYTCYPVVPIAFLLESGWITTVEELIAFIRKYPLTIDGGLNLSRAPANNTTLSELISIWLQRQIGSQLYAIHSVCALGHIQAFAILQQRKV